MVERGEPAARDRPLEPKVHGDGAAAVQLLVRGLAPDAYVPADLLPRACGKTRFTNLTGQTRPEEAPQRGPQGSTESPAKGGKAQVVLGEEC